MSHLTVMTFNIRNSHDSPWAGRRELVSAAIESVRPDAFGVQEAFVEQVEWLRQSLPDYECFGEGREGGRQGEYVAVFCDHRRFSLLAGGNLWLSETPAVPGKVGWDAECVRMATWTRLRRRSDGLEFALINCHLDHRGAEARMRSAELLWDLTLRVAGDAPAILMGDFNCIPGSEPYAFLTAPGRCADCWTEETGVGPATWHGFAGPEREGARIDWILSRGFAVLGAERVLWNRDGAWPSDHFPVIARFAPSAAAQP